MSGLHAVRESEQRDGGLGPVRHAESPVDLREVELDRVHAEIEAACGLRVRQACSDELQHFQLTRSERSQADAFGGGTFSLVEHEVIVWRCYARAYGRWASVSPVVP